MSGDETYHDLSDAAYRLQRNASLPDHLGKIFTHFGIPSTTEDIVQIGPGLGIESELIRGIFPNAHITVVDRNPIALKIAAPFVDDCVEGSAVNWIYESSNQPGKVDRLILALRTSPEIAMALMGSRLDMSERIFSLVGPKASEEDLVNTLRIQGQDLFPIEERRGFWEIGFRIH